MKSLGNRPPGVHVASPGHAELLSEAGGCEQARGARFWFARVSVGGCTVVSKPTTLGLACSEILK